MHIHKYSLSELEDMMPWERILYIDLLKDTLNKESERRRDMEAQQRREVARIAR